MNWNQGIATFSSGVIQALADGQVSGQSDGPEWATILTAIVALYAAVLSTFEFYSRRRASRPSIRVNMATGILALPQGPTNCELLVEAANNGEKAVTLNTQAQVKLPDGRRFLLAGRNSNVRFPYELQPGKNCMCWISLAELAAHLRADGFHGKTKLIGVYKDQLNNIYQSKPFEFDESGWPEKSGAA